MYHAHQQEGNCGSYFKSCCARYLEYCSYHLTIPRQNILCVLFSFCQSNKSFCRSVQECWTIVKRHDCPTRLLSLSSNTHTQISSVLRDCANGTRAALFSAFSCDQFTSQMINQLLDSATVLTRHSNIQAAGVGCALVPFAQSRNAFIT